MVGGRGAGDDRRAQGRSGSGYSPATLKGYEPTLRNRLVPEFGGRHAAEITELDRQLWVDRLGTQQRLDRALRSRHHLALGHRGVLSVVG